MKAAGIVRRALRNHKDDLLQTASVSSCRFRYGLIQFAERLHIESNCSNIQRLTFFFCICNMVLHTVRKDWLAWNLQKCEKWLMK